MTLMPDPRGLWIQAFMGMVFLNDNHFYAFFVFMIIHFLIIWQTAGVVAWPALMQWEFIGRMSFIYFWGALAGISVAIAVRTRALIPGHTTIGRQPRLGLLLATLCIFFGIRSVMILTGKTRDAAPFLPDPANPSTRIVFWVTVGLTAAGFITIMVLTYLQLKSKYLTSWLALSYRDNYMSSLIVDYCVALALVLSPQALWDFLVLAPYNWSQLWAGILTVGIELVVWVAIYLWFTRFRKIDTTHFSPQHSMVSFLEFCLMVGGTQIVNGVFYMIAAESYSAPLKSEQALAGFMGGVMTVSVILYWILNARRVKAQRAHRARGDGKEAVPLRANAQQPPHGILSL